MKRLAPVCISVFCLLAVLAVPAMAASQAADQTSTPGHTQGRVLELLDKLQENGYDVSAIRTAIQNGDTETAKTLMEQFRTAHPDAFPTRGIDTQNNEDRQARMLSFLDELQQKGYDISAIRTAIQNGDTETAKTLMEQFRTAHPDAFPSHTFMGKGRSSPQGTGSA